MNISGRNARGYKALCRTWQQYAVEQGAEFAEVTPDWFDEIWTLDDSELLKIFGPRFDKIRNSSVWNESVRSARVSCPHGYWDIDVTSTFGFLYEYFIEATVVFQAQTPFRFTIKKRRNVDKSIARFGELLTDKLTSLAEFSRVNRKLAERNKASKQTKLPVAEISTGRMHTDASFLIQASEGIESLFANPEADNGLIKSATFHVQACGDPRQDADHNSITLTRRVSALSMQDIDDTVKFLRATLDRLEKHSLILAVPETLPTEAL